MTPIWTGHVRTDGKWELDDPEGFRGHLVTFAGKPIEVVVRKLRAQRSNPQNNYYWGAVIEPLAEHLGYEAEELHDLMRVRFLSERDERGDVAHIRSTTKLTTTEFEDYLERIRRWAAEFHEFYIPLPNEVEVA